MVNFVYQHHMANVRLLFRIRHHVAKVIKKGWLRATTARTHGPVSDPLVLTVHNVRSFHRLSADHPSSSP